MGYLVDKIAVFSRPDLGQVRLRHAHVLELDGVELAVQRALRLVVMHAPLGRGVVGGGHPLRHRWLRDESGLGLFHSARGLRTLHGRLRNRVYLLRTLHHFLYRLV